MAKQYGNINNTEDVLFQQIKYYNLIYFIGDVNLLSKNLSIRLLFQVKLTICFHCVPFQKKNLENLS